MNIALLLADAAQIDEKDKIHALGLNWTHTGSPTPAMAIVAVIEMGDESLPTELALQIDLLDADGNPAKVGGAPGYDEPRSLVIHGRQPVDRFSGERAGEPVFVQLVVEIDSGLVFNPGFYSFKMKVTDEGTHEVTEASRKFRIRPPNESGNDEAV